MMRKGNYQSILINHAISSGRRMIGEELTRMKGIFMQRSRKFALAGHIGRRVDNRWSTVVLDWLPARGRRKQAHPITRWVDDFDNLMSRQLDGLGKGFWRGVVYDRAQWSELQKAFMVLRAPFIKIVWGAACHRQMFCGVEINGTESFFYSHPRPDMAGNHPNYILLGFGARVII